MERLAPFALAICMACGPALDAGRSTTASEPKLAAALVLPPSDDTVTTLATLEERAASSTEAAWMRLHYLLDAFDSARFTASARAREALFAALDAGPAARGADATNRVIDALLRATDDLLARAPDHPEGSRARVLLMADRQPPGSRGEILQRSIELTTLARSASALATNARLRLAAWCLRALDDAAAAPRRQAATMAAYCLYPLYDADPAPYFADEPDRRPPPPAPADLIDGTDALLATAEKTPSRLAPVATSLRRELEARKGALLAALPARPVPQALGVPKASPTTLYDQQPLVRASSRVDVNALRDRLVEQLARDDRRQVAVALPANDAGLIYPVAAAARAAGADELLVAVATEQRVQVPAGDYWERAGGLEPGLRTVPRLGVLPVAIAEPDPELGARATRWDPRRAQLKVHLLVSNKGWVVRTPGSVLADEPGPIAERVRAVREAFARVRDAFADESAAYLAIEPGTSTEQLARALEAATRTADGAPLLSALFLTTDIETNADDGLGKRIARRSAAHVDVRPQELDRRRPALRACYQRLLDDRELRGTVRLELRDGRARATGGPSPLRECATAALADLIESEAMASAEVSFSLAPR